MEGRSPTTYAQIVVAPDGAGLVLQYWLYFVYNDFNNTHESDWEMIQLSFDAASPAEALGQEPAQIALASARRRRNGRLGRRQAPEGGRPTPRLLAAGSHASQYGSNVYLGWGENGTGFGCDITTGPIGPGSPRSPLLSISERGPTRTIRWPGGLQGTLGRAAALGIQRAARSQHQARLDRPLCLAGRAARQQHGGGRRRDARPASDRLLLHDQRGRVSGCFRCTTSTRQSASSALLLAILVPLAADRLTAGGFLACGLVLLARTRASSSCSGLVLIPLALWPTASSTSSYLPARRRALPAAERAPGARLAAAITVGGFSSWPG